ncbi:MAG: hypothetical protein JNM66_21445 [Bryobacterales bacterium]|nr:hypothetical protein [Bryobacterales bacterium]
MPTKVIARAGDCLCGIASDFGFADCQPLRDAPENASLANRELISGEEVTVPDRNVEDHSKAVDAKHSFKLRTSPPVNIRFVHGSPNLPYRDDSETTTLHVSNFVTNLAGTDGLKALPTGYGYHDDGHADPDTFKVEVWDPAAGGSVNVKLEAMRPVYTADPVTGALTVTSFTPFTDAGRFIDPLVCNVVSAATSNTYRSKYMRLVVDEQDLAAPGTAGQLLLTTDVADGLGTGAAGDNDTVEILDQTVRATYEVQRCPGSPKCKVSKVVDIGGAARQRINLHFFAIRANPGVDTMPTGISAADIRQHLRRRTFKWYRRIFAQCDMAPLLATLSVIDPPENNMICISHLTGLPVATGAPVTIDITISTATRNIAVPTITFAGGETPVQAGDLIVANLPAGFSGTSAACTHANGNPNPSADVIITADNGERVNLFPAPVLSANPGISIDIPRVNLMSVLADDANADPALGNPTIDMKRLMRMIPTADDGMFCIVIGQFNTPGLRGQAFRQFHAATAGFQPPLPLRSATIMAYTSNSGNVLDNSDNLPFTSPHESAHVMCDLSHTIVGANHSRTEILGAGTPAANSVGGTKRFSDGPYLVRMMQRSETQPGGFEVQVKLADELRTQSAAKFRSW